MHEIYTYARSGDRVDESKSTRLLSFRLMLEEDARASRSEAKMENQVGEFRQSFSYRELLGIDGEPTEFEWIIFPGLTSLEILQKVQTDLQDQTLNLEF